MSGQKEDHALRPLGKDTTNRNRQDRDRIMKTSIETRPKTKDKFRLDWCDFGIKSILP